MSERITITEATGKWVVRGGGAILGETERALRLDEAGHDPVIYFPRDDVGMALLERSETRTHSPSKGDATHYSLQSKSMLIPDVAWSYEAPLDGATAVAGYLAFYPDKVAVEEI